MPIRLSLRLRVLWTGLGAGLLSACASVGTLQPFSTDGCSLFPDRSLVSSADWCGCCVAHDLSYWRGGTAEARRLADQELKRCVQAAAGSKALGVLMFDGVRLGGGPYFYTPYRWGYGWSFGRGYAPLTAQEEATATSLEAQYRAEHPALSCPGHEAEGH